MVWKEKVLIVKDALVEKPYLKVVFDSPDMGATPDFLSWLRQKFPFVSEEYLDFLSMFDGIQLDMYVLFGSGISGLPALHSRLPLWEGIVDFTEFLPIGEDASGNPFLIGKSGNIYTLPSDPAQDKIFITDSFDSLLDDFFLGEKYLSLFPYGRTDSEWLDFLKEKKWIN